MESSGSRLLAIAIALLLVGGIVAAQDRLSPKPVVVGTSNPNATGRLGTLAPGGCLPLPGAGRTPSWYPADLPLPSGSYPADTKLATTKGYPSAIFVAKGTLHDFVVFVLSEWRKDGWALGHGDAEAAEAEDSFFKPGTTTRGAFIARQDFCEQGWTWVYVVMGQASAPRPTARPTGSSTPISP